MFELFMNNNLFLQTNLDLKKVSHASTICYITHEICQFYDHGVSI